MRIYSRISSSSSTSSVAPFPWILSALLILRPLFLGLLLTIIIMNLHNSFVSAFLATTVATTTSKTYRSSVVRSIVYNHNNNDDNDDIMDDDTIHHYQNLRSPVTVWVEDAESGFVDEDENLEDGEVCLRAVKAFASPSSSPPPSSSLTTKTFKFNEHSDDEDQEHKRFLCAGALVRRPSTPETIDDEDSTTRGSQLSSSSSSSGSSSCSRSICDVWIADSILDDGGPNLQIQGAVQVLDTLLLDFLVREHSADKERENDDTKGLVVNNNTTINSNNPDLSIECLRNFIVHCGETVDQHHTCASFMAAQTMRGFIPLRDAVRQNSIYSRSHYGYYDLDGMVLEPTVGIQRYKESFFEKNQNHDELRPDRTTAKEADSSTTVIRQILDLLPDEETIRRYTIKRFTLD